MNLIDAVRSGKKFKRLEADDFFWIHVDEDGFIRYVSEYLTNENPFSTIYHITGQYEVAP